MWGIVYGYQEAQIPILEARLQRAVCTVQCCMYSMYVRIVRYSTIQHPRPALPNGRGSSVLVCHRRGEVMRRYKET
jgi:hypothetical protein